VRILITGENSFVGRNFINYSIYKEIEEISLIGIKTEDINLSCYDIIIHVAAIVHQSREILESEYYSVNRDLTIEVARQAKKSGVKQFIFLSTVKVYGDFNPASGPWTETSECHPEDPYGKSKFEAENELLKLQDDNFIISIIRTPLVYGKGVRANMLSIMKLVDRIKFLPFGNVTNKRSFTYVRNLIGFIDKIVEKQASGVFIAMDANPLSTTELVRLISKYLNKKRLLISLPKFMINTGKKLAPGIFERLYGSFEMENSQTLKTLDFTPQFSSEEGIREMCLSYKESKKRGLFNSRCEFQNSKRVHS